MPFTCGGPRVRKGAMGEDIPLDVPERTRRAPSKGSGQAAGRGSGGGGGGSSFQATFHDEDGALRMRVVDGGRVISVLPGPAEDAGVTDTHRVISVNGQPVQAATTAREVNAMLKQLRPVDVAFEPQSDGSEQTWTSGRRKGKVKWRNSLQDESERAKDRWGKVRGAVVKPDDDPTLVSFAENVDVLMLLNNLREPEDDGVDERTEETAAIAAEASRRRLLAQMDAALELLPDNASVSPGATRIDELAPSAAGFSRTGKIAGGGRKLAPPSLPLPTKVAAAAAPQEATAAPALDMAHASSTQEEESVAAAAAGVQLAGLVPYL